MGEHDDEKVGSDGSIQPPFDLGPEDYLIYPRSVHVMRYRGRNSDGFRWWRIACGTRLSPAVMDDALGVDLESALLHEMALCGRCKRTKARYSGGDEVTR